MPAARPAEGGPHHLLFLSRLVGDDPALQHKDIPVDVVLREAGFFPVLGFIVYEVGENAMQGAVGLLIHGQLRLGEHVARRLVIQTGAPQRAPAFAGNAR